MMAKAAILYARVSSRAQADKGHKTVERVTSTLDYEQLTQILMFS
jgi:predicted site-specific integrase-resolvase